MHHTHTHAKIVNVCTECSAHSNERKKKHPHITSFVCACARKQAIAHWVVMGDAVGGSRLVYIQEKRILFHVLHRVYTRYFMRSFFMAKPALKPHRM